MSDYYCLPTNIGLAKLSAFATGGTPITLTHFAVGDANGTPYLPETRVSANTLVHERHRATIESVLESPFDNTVSIATLNLPANVGGWRICEIALIDADGDIIYLANYPNNYKPTLAEGAGGELEIPVYLQSSAAGSIAVVVDPNVLSASRNWVSSNFALKTELQVETDSRNASLIALMQRLVANGIDADLAITNNATGSDFNDAQFKQTGIWYFDHALNTSQENTAGIIRSHKAGNKVYHHEILETGRQAVRIFDGTNWGAWIYQTQLESGTVPLVPISAFGDLNTYETAGNYSFKSSDNLLNAPPNQGTESDFELQVITESNGIIQIVKNITTQTDFVRVKNGGNWQLNWQSTAPIQNIVSGINLDAVRSEGVYLCINPVINLLSNIDTIVLSTTITVCILQVKNSDTLQSVVQILQLVNGEFSQSNWGSARTILFRSAMDGSTNDNQFNLWRPVNKVPVGPYKNLESYGSGYVFYYLDLDTTLTYHNDLNRLLQQGFYVFSLTDDISNIPAQFTDSNFFLFLFVEIIEDENNADWTVTQQIYQYMNNDNYEHRLIRQQTFSPSQQGQPITATWTTYAP